MENAPAAHDSLSETQFWEAQPGVIEDVAAARRQAADGELHSAAEVRARYRP
ncbi:hypothetical protein [Microbacterium lushaniae]|uniref:hypothetical protein n=1 Tax=Microbacterium lushaniae TaxID=2614639 RepID=UPI00178284CB|nr:hypothetical protein [Microbacterium lushaniae]